MTQKVKFWNWKKAEKQNLRSFPQRSSDSAEERHQLEAAKIQRWLELADSILKRGKNSRTAA